jgi:hypothetical protein
MAPQPLGPQPPEPQPLGPQPPEPQPPEPQPPEPQPPEPLRVRLQQVGPLWPALAPGAPPQSTAALGPSRRAGSALARQTDSALPRPLEARVWAPAQRARPWEFARPSRWLWGWPPA